MDKTKLKVLQDLNYTIRETCGLCTHGEFPNNEWGTCKAQSYEHEKHTGPPRQLSINKYGHCGQFLLDIDLRAGLGEYYQLIEYTT